MSSTRLFDDVPRASRKPKSEAENLFHYYNSSGRPSVAALRELMETWFSEFPDREKADVRGRIRSAIDFQHQSAFFEMYLFRLLRGMGLDPSAHPDLPSGKSTHPDFMFNGGAHVGQVYFEATVVTDGAEAMADDARKAVVYDVLNRLESPKFFFDVVSRGAPATPPPTKQWRKELRAWLAGLDADALCGPFRQSGLSGLPVKVLKHEAWLVEIRPIPKSAAANQPGNRTIGLRMEGMTENTLSLNIAERIRDKANHYGNLGRPFIIALDVLSLFVPGEDIIDALFGTPQVTLNMVDSQVVSMTTSRKPDGAWVGPGGPTNTRVSAVLITSNLSPWNVGEKAPVLVHNPWATHPLAKEAWPLKQFFMDGAGSIQMLEGKHPTHFLNLPPNWPPDAEDTDRHVRRLHERREAAYYRWMNRGCPIGDDWADWFAAKT